jgi:5-methylcytosine-specific restriction protein A
MSFETGLVQGQIIDNQVLCQIFGCGPQGGMRRSLKTNTLVLISNHVESIYDDRWLGGVFHYTGMGQKGNQSLTFNQNKTLAESRSNGVEIHLFEVNKEKEYTYQGRVSLASDPYTEIQPDIDKLDRNVFVFPLVLFDNRPVPLDTTDFKKAQKIREKKAKKLSDEELLSKASKAPKKAGERTVTGIQYERDPYVSRLTKRRAKGICELCEQPAPFADTNGEPYLETHHVDWLARGGDDSLSNTVALCPNCHRKIHVLDLEVDKTKLKAKLLPSAD